MGKRATIHFLTAYVEYLLDQGIRSEEYVFRRRFPFSPLPAGQYHGRTGSKLYPLPQLPAYRARLEKTLRKFFLFAQEKLAIEVEQIVERQKKTRSKPV